MAEYQEYLAILDSDPSNAHAIGALEKLLPSLPIDEAATALDAARESLRERGKIEVVVRLFDVEIRAAQDSAHVAELLHKKAQLYAEEFFTEKDTIDCFRQVLELSPDHADAQEELANLDLWREKWRSLVDKYLEEAGGSTDKSLAASLYVSAAATVARYEPNSEEVETYLRKALEIDSGNRRAAVHLERWLRQHERWDELIDLLDSRVEAGTSDEERIDALVALAEIADTQLGDSHRAVECMKRVASMDPSHPRALSMLSNTYERDQNWSALVMLYTRALKARRRGAGTEVEVGTLLQIGMLHWKRLENPEAAEEYFRRIRKIDPAHPAALSFYREHLRQTGDASQLLQIYRQALKSVPDSEPDRRRQLAIDIAEISEVELANPEKAIEAWKSFLRSEPGAPEAREALRRLYARAEKWNALLDLIKEDIERLPPDDVEGRIGGLLQVVAIYRDHIRVAGDVMAINTYNEILALDPHHREAIDALAERYEQAGRWNDLTAVLSRKADLPGLSNAERVAILHTIAELWVGRFGNYAQAIGPLERILDLAPGDRKAIETLKDIFERRRQWRSLIALYGREAAALTVAERRPLVVKMAQLAAGRLGDPRLAIEMWNRVLEIDETEHGAGSEGQAECLSALATLYEREKRYLALVDVYGRQKHLTDDPHTAISLLDKQGAILAERLEAPVQAAQAYQQILDLDPRNARAARTLREIYTSIRDFDSLEQLYSRLGQWDELVDALQSAADRMAEREPKLDLLVRAARVSHEHSSNQDRVARAWERVATVDPGNVDAARALVGIYSQVGKSARLLSCYEVLLEHAPDDDSRLDLLREIRILCEQRLGSKALAFQWAARAYRLRPSDSELLGELERLGAEADAWDEVAGILDERLESGELSDEEKLRVMRELGKIASGRLHQPDRAHGYWERVLEARPNDSEAIAALEEIATHQADWPDLLKIYRRRVEFEQDDAKRLDLLFRIAFLEEERLADLDAATQTYRSIVDIDPSSRRALKHLSQLCDARGDYDGLADVLGRELELTADADGKVALLLRQGDLYRTNLGDTRRALDAYRIALELQPSSQIHRILEEFTGEEFEPAMRREVAQLLLPAYEQAEDHQRVARAIEILRQDCSEDEAANFDRQLLHLYASKLARPEQAYETGLRVVARDPADAAVRDQVVQLADVVGKSADLADRWEQLLVDLEKDGEADVRKDLAHELAELYLDKLARPEDAERAWRTVLAIDHIDPAAHAGLERIYNLGARWDDLRQLLESQLELAVDNVDRVEKLFRIAELSEGLLSEPDTASVAYRRILEVDPAELRAFKALERLDEAAGRWAELEELLAREQEYTDDEEQVRLLVRRARLRSDKNHDATGAVDLLEDVLARQRGNMDAREHLEELMGAAEQRLRCARILEPLYQEDGLWRDLCLALRAQRDHADSPDLAAELLSRIAQTEEERLGHERGAFSTWCEVLEVAPGDERAADNVVRLGRQIGNWDEVVTALELALSEIADHDLSARLALLTEIAHLSETQLGDRDKARSAYQELIEADPGNPDTVRPAAAALDRIYSEEESWPELISIVRRQADWAEPGPERIGLLARLAQLEEERAGDTGAAISAWREVLAEEPDHGAALDALERLHHSRSAWVELADVIRRRVELGESAEDKKYQLVRLANLYERELDSPSDAVLVWLEVLDVVPEDIEPLDQLARLYRLSERWADLFDILERRLASAEQTGEQIALMCEAGELLREHLGRPSEALENFARVLELQPDHGGALARVEGFLADPDLKLRSSDVLLPIYEQSGQYDKLAELLMLVADAVDDPRSRLRHLRRVAELREDRLDDRDGALAAYRQAALAAVAEPELADVLRDLERLASDEGKLGELIDVYEQVAPDVFDGELQRRLYLDIADLARGVRSDDDTAERYYRLVLDQRPDDSRALTALEGIYRDAGNHDALHDVLVRRAELAGDDLEARSTALARAAELCQGPLDRAEDAILLWEQVLELLPGNQQAAAALEQLYEVGERWHDLTDLLERRLGYAFTVEDAVHLHVRLGQLSEKRLFDPDKAVESYGAALSGDPSNEPARAALEKYLDDAGLRSSVAQILEPIYVASQDWPKLVRIYEIKLESAVDHDERLQLSRYIARLHEDQLDDLEGSFHWYGRVFKESPKEPGLRSQLVRLAGVLDSWSDLANIYQDYLDDHPGDDEDAREIALALADLCDTRLNEVERAHEAYRRVLQMTPTDHQTFARLEAMLTRAQRWFALVEDYQEAIQVTLEDDRRLELYRRMAQVNEERLSDVARAIECYRAALDIDPDYGPAISGLERLYQEQGQWYELAELLGARIDRAEEIDQRLLRLQLADVLENRLNDIIGAIEQHEKILDVGLDADALSELERLVVMEEHRQRIAAILEPIYRRHDWWRKLVVILGAQLDFVDDPAQRVAMLREIAEIHETRGGDLNLALEALSAAWLQDIGDDEVYLPLAALTAKLSAWDELVETMGAGIEDELDSERVISVLRRMAEVHEQHRADRSAAIDTLRRILEVRDDDGDALANLDRLLEAEERYHELVDILTRRAELSFDDDSRKLLLVRIATLHETVLVQPREAIAGWRAVLAVDDTDAAALDALERLYRLESDPRELVLILARKIELAEDAEAARHLRFAAAQVYERELDERFEAISQMREVVATDPDDREALEVLDRLYSAEESWPDLLEVLDRRAALEVDRVTSADLSHRAALIVAERLLEPERAIDRLRDLLAAHPSHSGARDTLDAMTREDDTLLAAADVLAELYRSEGAFDKLVELGERRLGSALLEREQRVSELIELAELHEHSRGDSGAAFDAWSRALREDPEGERAAVELERLVSASGDWNRLVNLYEDVLADSMAPELEYRYATAVARIYEEAVGDLDKSAERHRRALDVADDERATLDALARIYERAGRYEELAEILSRQVDAWLEESKQAELLFTLGVVREERLEDPAAAVMAYRDVIDREPGHGAARAALERLVLDERVRAEVVTILEPLYETEHDDARLADLLVTKLSITDDAHDRASLYARVAELAENQLGDPVRALDAAGGWLAEDPGSEQAMAEVERLAETTGRWTEMVARIEGIVSSGETPDLEVPLMLKLGQVQLDRVRDLDAAQSTFRRVLERDGENLRALAQLERIFREQNDAAQLGDVLWRRGEVVFDVVDKRACFAEVAALREEQGDPAGAIEAWGAVLEIDEGDREALSRAGAIYERHGEWQQLIETLDVTARFCRDVAEEREVKARIAMLWQDKLEDLEQAAQAWQSVLDLEPGDRAALDALEAIHRRREDWPAVQDIMTRRLDFAEDDTSRVEIYLRMADVAENHRKELDNAVSYLQQVLDIDSTHLATYDRLEGVFRSGERWHELVELYERRAEMEAEAGRTHDEIHALAKMADIWEGPLEDPDAAGEILAKLLERKPDFVPALTRLARIYEAADEWERSTELLQQALELGPTGSDAADLHVRLGVAARHKAEQEGAGGDGGAMEHYLEALQHDPQHAEALAAAEQVAHEREDWVMVADLMGRRHARTHDREQRLELACELAQLWSERLGQPARAVPLLEEAAKIDPDDTRALAPLADAYMAAGRFDEAAPMLEKLADEAKKQRKMKDVAQHRSRLGHLYRSTGQPAKAIEAYQEAFRIDPTNVATMLGLGALHVEQEEWDKARRVYRSLVLQNIDPSYGVTKGDIYHQLGLIHIELGETGKAKGMFQRALEVDPDNETFKQSLADLG